MIRNCNSGFHGSLAEDLTNKKCPKCGRNYTKEDFIEACKFFNIDPNDQVQIRDLSNKLVRS